MVKRYDYIGQGDCEMAEFENGPYVHYEDYQALEAEMNKLKELYKKMTESRNDWRDIAQRGSAQEG